MLIGYVCLHTAAVETQGLVTRAGLLIRGRLFVGDKG